MTPLRLAVSIACAALAATALGALAEPHSWNRALAIYIGLTLGGGVGWIVVRK